MWENERIRFKSFVVGSVRVFLDEQVVERHLLIAGLELAQLAFRPDVPACGAIGGIEVVGERPAIRNILAREPPPTTHDRHDTHPLVVRLIERLPF